VGSWVDRAEVDGVLCRGTADPSTALPAVALRMTVLLVAGADDVLHDQDLRLTHISELKFGAPNSRP
jgi:hypothetical protein